MGDAAKRIWLLAAGWSLLLVPLTWLISPNLLIWAMGWYPVGLGAFLLHLSWCEGKRRRVTVWFSGTAATLIVLMGLVNYLAYATEFSVDGVPLTAQQAWQDTLGSIVPSVLLAIVFAGGVTALRRLRDQKIARAHFSSVLPATAMPAE